MLYQGFGKMVASVLTGNEIQVRRFDWVERGDDGFHSRAGDGAGRKAWVHVGVVGGIDGQIFFADVPVKIVDGVYHRRVRLQEHSFLQAIMKY